MHLRRFPDTAQYYSICFLDSQYADTIKYFGTVSGKDENKMKNCGLNVVQDLAPYFENSEQSRPYFKQANNIFLTVKNVKYN